MNRRIGHLIVVLGALALAGCPRDEAPRSPEPASDPALPAAPSSLATPMSAPMSVPMSMPKSVADPARPAQSGHSRGPAPEPEPATPPPPVDR